MGDLAPNKIIMGGLASLARGGATIGVGGFCNPNLFQMVVFLLYWFPHLKIRGAALAPDKVCPC